MHWHRAGPLPRASPGWPATAIGLSGHWQTPRRDWGRAGTFNGDLRWKVAATCRCSAPGPAHGAQSRPCKPAKVALRPGRHPEPATPSPSGFKLGCAAAPGRRGSPWGGCAQLELEPGPAAGAALWPRGAQPAVAPGSRPRNRQKSDGPTPRNPPGRISPLNSHLAGKIAGFRNLAGRASAQGKRDTPRNCPKPHTTGQLPEKVAVPSPPV